MAQNSKYTQGCIYQIYFKPSGKSYIGKAQNYVSGNKEWGSIRSV